MAVKKENKVVGITLPKYHQKKLEIIRNRMGLTNSGVVMRWIEQYKLFDTEEDKLEGLKPSSLER